MIQNVKNRQTSPRSQECPLSFLNHHSEDILGEGLVLDE
jgi:hypothetical protein